MTSSKSSSRDYLHDPNISLGEKLRRRYKEKSSRMGPNTDPVSLNRWGPWVLLFLLCGAGGWGTVVAMPVLYAGGWEGWLGVGRVWVGVMVVEAALNWCLCRWVSSGYRPHVHGARPAHFHQPGNEASDSSDLAHAGRGTEDSQSLSCPEKRGPENSGVCDNSNSGTHTSSRKEGGVGDGGVPSRSPAKARAHDGYSYTMWVAVALPTANGHVERRPFSYWSWVKCLMCHRERPPRCHHCTLCGVCVLKRDHHCYLTGACVGVNNHRFFLVFLFWGVLLTAFGTAHMLPYTFLHVVPHYNVSVLDFIPPVALLRGLLGYVHLVIPVLSLLFWLLLFFLVFASGMLVHFAFQLGTGRTSFERDHGIKVTDTRPLSGKLRSVFGDHWWLNFVLPTYPWFKPEEDAVLWPDIKPC
ncbi:uncharacterized protein LOC143286469 [Babylonia areolata]|uniref:uncharacterized protein LOC143286469 n=1 Tax=Babylonia areolata TaxID=304850 RepID=UPI003FD36545